MELKMKIAFTLMFVLGFFILRVISKSNNNRLKNRLEKSNPKLVEKADGFFSETKQKTLNTIFGIMLFVFLILLWTNQTIIPIK
jgi:F0F1-type ATP synthase membrane subunit a